MPTAADRGRVRTLIADPVPAPPSTEEPVMSDEQLDEFLSDNSTTTTDGTTYNYYGAAADALRAWAAKLKLQYDVTTAGDDFRRSQKVQNLLTLAADYDGRAGGRDEAITGGGIGAALHARTDWRGF